MRQTKVIVAMVLMVSAGLAQAISTSEYLMKYEETRNNSRNGTLDYLSESFELVALLAEWTAQRVAESVNTVGQVQILPPSPPFPSGPNYAFYKPYAPPIELLTYNWMDATTLAEVALPSDIAGVRYEFNIDTDLGIWTLIDESFNAASNFAVNFTPTGYEPLIRATPLDVTGAVIPFISPSGSEYGQAYAMHLEVIPVPAAAWLFGIGLAGLGHNHYRTRRRHKH